MLGIPRSAERYTPLPITAMHEGKDHGSTQSIVVLRCANIWVECLINKFVVACSSCKHSNIMYIFLRGRILLGLA